MTPIKTELTYKMENWLADAKAPAVDYFDYWNNENFEKDKEWYVLDGDFKKMETYLSETGFVSDLTSCLDILAKDYGVTLSGTGIDLAAGNLWAIPHLLSQSQIEKIYCLEFSKHRLLKLGPYVLQHYQIPADKAVLVWGSFYDLRLPDASLDFVFLSAAFHHADKPEALLREIKRVLKPKGVVILIGEHRVNFKKILKQAAKNLLSHLPEKGQTYLLKRTLQRRSMNPFSIDFMDVDPVLGDHEYADGVYQRMFSKAGFKMRRVPGSAYQSFLLFLTS